MKINQKPSPNYGERRLDAIPDLIVLHYTAMADCNRALQWLCDSKSEVSAHYLISAQGEVFQMVQENDRAWHAGAGAWGGCDDVNSRSVGIELANDGCSPFGAAQIDALELLLTGIMGRWSIPPERVIGHSDMALGRKIDPGGRFDWRRLARTGLSVWPDLSANRKSPKVAEFRRMARRFGYPDSGADAQILDAFRQRFLPGKIGALDAADMAVLGDLALRYPVDETAQSN